ncbi:MAG: hypothetical protein ABWY80_06150 [Acidimicrobiia bacterium]
MHLRFEVILQLRWVARQPQLMCTPLIARAITRRWISEVPSKIVEMPPICLAQVE